MIPLNILNSDIVYVIFNLLFYMLIIYLYKKKYHEYSLIWSDQFNGFISFNIISQTKIKLSVYYFYYYVNIIELKW